MGNEREHRAKQNRSSATEEEEEQTSVSMSARRHPPFSIGEEEEGGDSFFSTEFASSAVGSKVASSFVLLRLVCLVVRPGPGRRDTDEQPRPAGLVLQRHQYQVGGI